MNEFRAWVESWWTVPNASVVFVVGMFVWGAVDLWRRRRK